MTTTAWYVTANEFEYLQLSVFTMAQKKWINNLVIVHTDTERPAYFGELQNTFRKVKELHQPFGHGFEKSIENGGFDEVSARNYAIANAEETGDDWLLQIDSDEIFSNDTELDILHADLNGFDSVICSTYHFFSPQQYAVMDEGYQQRAGVTVYDPHVRIWRSGLKARYYRNPNADFLARYANKSVHCVHSGEVKPYVTGKMLHLHYHNMFGKKVCPLPEGATLVNVNNHHYYWNGLFEQRYRLDKGVW